jgi:ribulose bisphosphate carboxylase small subunit
MDQVERTTQTKYVVSMGYEEGIEYDTLKDARVTYKEMTPDEWDGVFLQKKVTEVITIITTETVQRK